MTFKRHAIYVTLPDGPLARFGAAWLGRDIATGSAVPQPDLGLDVEPLTRTPRRYGLHATIKPPFRLAEGTTAEGLEEALAVFCAGRRPVVLDGLRLARMGRFLALVPVGDVARLNALAGAAVRGLDRFRGPLTDAELARRRAGGLSVPEERNLAEWGYPHVLDCYRFHITLTGPLEDAEAAQVQAALAPQLEPLLQGPFAVDALTLCGEDAQGQFQALRRVPLGG